MKKLILLLVFFTGIIKAQDLLYREWHVSCPIGQKDPATLEMCSLCPFFRHDNGVTLQGFGMTVTKEQITFVFNGGLTKKVPYAWYDDTKSIAFTLDGKAYTFSVLYFSNKIAGHFVERLILKESDGTLLALDGPVLDK